MTIERKFVKVAVINRKGGTGKTTVSANLAGELANRGYNVGAVDTDAQGGGHLGICLGVPAADGLYRALVEGAALDAVITPVDAWRYVIAQTSLREARPSGALWVLPAAKKTVLIPDQVDNEGAFGWLLDEFAERKALDIVLIDTGPSMTKFDGSIYAAVDCFLYVTQAETLASVGIADSFDEIQAFNLKRIRGGLPPNKVLGIVPNLVGRLREHSINLNALGEAFGAAMVWPPIRRLNVYSQMAARGQIVRAYAPRGQEAESMIALAERFENEVTTWLTNS